MATSQSGSELIPVTESNFTRAEAHLYFGNSLKGGGAGRFHHVREVISIDNQTVIRANRDTLYSSGVFDLDAGPVTVTLSDAGGRFMSMIAIDEDEYAVETVYAPGRFTYTKERVGTRYVLLGLRTFVDPNDPKDIEMVHALQDSVRADQPATGTFEFPNWDPVSQKNVREDLIKRAGSLPDTQGMFGQRGKVDPERHLIGAATGWGGNAPDDALYLTVVPAKNDGQTVHKLTVTGDVPVDGFWSISVYGADGYFHKNDQHCVLDQQRDGEESARWFGDDPVRWLRRQDCQLHSHHGRMELPHAVCIHFVAPELSAQHPVLLPRPNHHEHGVRCPSQQR
jgi:hypothetical protein